MKVYSNYKLLAVRNEMGLFYHKGSLYQQNLKSSEKPRFLCELPFVGKKKYMVKCRFLERMFRLEPRVAASVDRGFVVSCAGAIYRIDMSTGRISKELILRPRMNNPLAFTHTTEGTLLFGEYFSNNDNEEVCIFERTAEKWEKVYAFPRNTIYHIHGIVSAEEGIYVLTGDDDSESAIWFTSDRFRTVEKIVGGNQKYRACVAFPFGAGLVYATDTPLAQNELYYIHKEDGKWKIQTLYEMPGPCIYGTKVNDVMYFATSVEPDARFEDTMRYRFTYKLGEGVKDRYTHIIKMSQDGKISEVCKMKKDILPMLLFQFGNIQFPDTVNNDTVFVTPISVKKYDGKTIKLS